MIKLKDLLTQRTIDFDTVVTAFTLDKQGRRLG